VPGPAVPAQDARAAELVGAGHVDLGTAHRGDAPQLPAPRDAERLLRPPATVEPEHQRHTDQARADALDADRPGTRAVGRGDAEELRGSSDVGGDRHPPPLAGRRRGGRGGNRNGGHDGGERREGGRQGGDEPRACGPDGHQGLP
jgi:hypothetical protein